MGELLKSDLLILLLMALVAFGWAVAIAYVRPAWIAGLALGGFAFGVVFGEPPGLDVGGILVYPKDLAFTAMAVVAVLRVLFEPGSGRRADRAWFALILLALLSFARGVQVHGPDLAGNDFREIFYVLAALSFFATHRREPLIVRHVVDVWIGLGLALLAVGLLRIIGVGVGAAAQTEALSGGRALFAQPTLFILQAGLLAFFAGPLHSRWAGVPGLPWALLSGVVLFQHRSVWAAMAVSLAAMWTVLRADRGPAGSRFTLRLGGVVIVTGLLVLLIEGGKIGAFQSQLATSVASATGQDSTFAWRLEGWRYLLEEQQAHAQDLIVGIPYGSGYRRTVAGGVVEVSPHSWYVTAISRVGVVGTAVLLFGLAGLFRRGRPAGLLPANLGALLVISAAVFGLAYQLPETQGILLGVVALASSPASTAPAAVAPRITHRSPVTSSWLGSSGL